MEDAAYRDRVRTVTAPVENAADARNLQPIRLYLTDFVLVGSVVPEDERMTDILNRGGELPVLPAGADPADEESWIAIPVDEILMVVPPPHVSPPEKRMARDKHVVRMRVAEWHVTGTAHLKPGAEQDAILLSTTPFLPLTGATMSSAEVPFGEAHEVLIVDLRHAEFGVD